jgi:hypothetical protein
MQEKDHHLARTYQYEGWASNGVVYAYDTERKAGANVDPAKICREKDFYTQYVGGKKNRQIEKVFGQLFESPWPGLMAKFKANATPEQIVNSLDPNDMNILVHWAGFVRPRSPWFIKRVKAIAKHQGFSEAEAQNQAMAVMIKQGMDMSENFFPHVHWEFWFAPEGKEWLTSDNSFIAVKPGMTGKEDIRTAGFHSGFPLTRKVLFTGRTPNKGERQVWNPKRQCPDLLML